MDKVVTDLIGDDSKKKGDDKTFLSSLSESADEIKANISPSIKNMNIPDFKSLSKKVSDSISSIVPSIPDNSKTPETSKNNTRDDKELEMPEISKDSKQSKKPRIFILLSWIKMNDIILK